MSGIRIVALSAIVILRGHWCGSCPGLGRESSAAIRAPHRRSVSPMPNYYWTATPSSATRCRHPTVDASIFTWMAPGHLHGDSLRPAPGITIGCGFVDDAAVQAERDHAIAAQLPDPSLWIPRPTGLLHPVADCHVGTGDA